MSLDFIIRKSFNSLQTKVNIFACNINKITYKLPNEKMTENIQFNGLFGLYDLDYLTNKRIEIINNISKIISI